MSRVILIGFMGVGKTTIGRKLAKKMKSSFVDLDRKIEEETGQSVAHIFSEQGEKFFRELENKALTKEYPSSVVISAGGGITTYDVSFDWLKKHHVVIYLEASNHLLYRRIKTSRGRERPLAKNKNKKELSVLMKKREKGYQDVADLVVSVDHKTVNHIVDEILDKLSKINKF